MKHYQSKLHEFFIETKIQMCKKVLGFDQSDVFIKFSYLSHHVFFVLIPAAIDFSSQNGYISNASGKSLKLYPWQAIISSSLTAEKLDLFDVCA